MKSTWKPDKFLILYRLTATINLNLCRLQDDVINYFEFLPDNKRSEHRNIRSFCLKLLIIKRTDIFKV